LRGIPIDPFTHSSKTWVPTYEDDDKENTDAGGLFSDDDALEEKKGIIDVHSASDLIAIDGTPLSEWRGNPGRPGRAVRGPSVIRAQGVLVTTPAARRATTSSCWWWRSR